MDRLARLTAGGCRTVETQSSQQSLARHTEGGPASGAGRTPTVVVVRSPSSLIFLVLLGVWAAYFVAVLAASARPPRDRAFGRAVQRGHAGARAARRAAPHRPLRAGSSLVCRAPAPAPRGPQVLVKRAVAAEPAATGVSARVPSETTSPRPEAAAASPGGPSARRSARDVAPARTGAAARFVSSAAEPPDPGPRAPRRARRAAGDRAARRVVARCRCGHSRPPCSPSVCGLLLGPVRASGRSRPVRARRRRRPSPGTVDAPSAAADAAPAVRPSARPPRPRIRRGRLRRRPWPSPRRRTPVASGASSGPSTRESPATRPSPRWPRRGGPGGRGHGADRRRGRHPAHLGPGARSPGRRTR